MSKPLVKRIPFAKIVLILAVVFLVSLGLCGLTVFLSSSGHMNSDPFTSFGILELIAMLLSLAGLLITLFFWALFAIVGSFGHSTSQTEQPFHELDETKHDNDR